MAPRTFPLATLRISLSVSVCPSVSLLVCLSESFSECSSRRLFAHLSHIHTSYCTSQTFSVHYRPYAIMRSHRLLVSSWASFSPSHVLSFCLRFRLPRSTPEFGHLLSASNGYYPFVRYVTYRVPFKIVFRVFVTVFHEFSNNLDQI